MYIKNIEKQGDFYIIWQRSQDNDLFTR